MLQSSDDRRAAFLRTRLLLGTLMIQAALVVTLPNSGRAEFLNAAFSQQNFNLDGVIYNNTEWGSVEVTYTGTASIEYLNLAVNGTWQIENIPLLSIEGVGVAQRQTFSFDLGTPRGVPDSSLNYSLTITPTVLNGPPSGSTTAAVTPRSIVFGSGAAEVPVVPPLPAAAPLIGGQVADSAKHTHAGFPNQEAGDKECAPVAVSNSLMYLGVGVNIAGAKVATNWGLKHPTPTVSTLGAWITHDDTRPAGERNAWYEDKAAFLRQNRIPVSSTLIQNIGGIAAELDAGEDVELQGDWHTAAIVGIAPLAIGGYAIGIAHDTMQGVNGGTITDTIRYNSFTGKFEGSPGFFDGSSFRYAVSESPIGIPEPPAVVLFGIGALGLLGYSWRQRGRGE